MTTYRTSKWNYGEMRQETGMGMMGNGNTAEDVPNASSVTARAVCEGYPKATLAANGSTPGDSVVAAWSFGYGWELEWW